MKFSYIQLITRNTGARRKMSPNLPSVVRPDILTFLYFQLEMAFTKTSLRQAYPFFGSVLEKGTQNTVSSFLSMALCNYKLLKRLTVDL